MVILIKEKNCLQMENFYNLDAAPFILCSFRILDSLITLLISNHTFDMAAKSCQGNLIALEQLLLSVLLLTKGQ